jgi:hypothetical protein
MRTEDKRPISNFLIDSDFFNELCSLEGQIPYQTELTAASLSHFQESAQAQLEKQVLETKSMTNLTAEGEYNPFLTYMKLKTKILDSDQLSRREATELWIDYKKSLNKIHPILESHAKSKSCRLSLLLLELCNYVAQPFMGNHSEIHLDSAMSRLEEAAEFASQYMVIYYALDLYKNPKTDISLIFKFFVTSAIFKDRVVNARLVQFASNTSYKLVSNMPRKIMIVTEVIMNMDQVKRYMNKDTSADPQEKAALMKDKMSKEIYHSELLSKGKKPVNRTGQKRKLEDQIINEMLRISRDSTTPSNYLLQGINLSYRECPYVMLLNIFELENRLDANLASKDLEGFKTIVQSTVSDLMSSMLIIDCFFRRDKIISKLPYSFKICDALRLHVETSEVSVDATRTPITSQDDTLP